MEKMSNVDDYSTSIFSYINKFHTDRKIFPTNFYYIAITTLCATTFDRKDSLRT